MLKYYDQNIQAGFAGFHLQLLDQQSESLHQLDNFEKSDLNNEDPEYHLE